MIKRLELVSRHAGLSRAEFCATWPRTAALVARAPSAVRPLRAVVCTPVLELTGPGPLHDAISIQWFADLSAVYRFEAWLSSAPAQAPAIEPAKTVVIHAHELVMRGAAWLEQRWSAADGGDKLKHMALSRRAEGLTPAQFSERWQSRPGKIGGAGSAPAIVIPEEAKGHAYVQNHPVPADVPWRYDAINEVYFDDRAALQRRIAFFEAHDVGRVDADLVSEANFIAVSEHIVCGGRPC